MPGLFSNPFADWLAGNPARQELTVQSASYGETIQQQVEAAEYYRQLYLAQEQQQASGQLFYYAPSDPIPDPFTDVLDVSPSESGLRRWFRRQDKEKWKR